MPPQLSLPVVRPRPESGYTAMYASSRLTIARPIRTYPGDDSSDDGMNLQITNLGPEDPERQLLAMTKAHVLFSYLDRGDEGNPHDRRRIRAVLQLASDIHTGTGTGRNSDVLKLSHPELGLGNIHENFVSLTYMEYRNLDRERTSRLILQLINDAVSRLASTPNDPNALWINNTPVVTRAATRRQEAVTQPLKNWLRDHSVEDYVNLLFDESNLLLLTADFPAEDRPSRAGLRVNAGDVIGYMARSGNNPPAEIGHCNVFIRFLDGGEQILNPYFFINAVVRHTQREGATPIDFVADRQISDDNQLGIGPLIQGEVMVDVDTPPGDLTRRIHPLIWTIASDSLGVFEPIPGTSTQVRPAPYPHLFVPSASLRVLHERVDGTIIDRNERRLSEFHSHRRLIEADSDLSEVGCAGGVCEGSRYQWKLDANGYLVYRTNGNPPVDDDWYPIFAARDLQTIENIWRHQGHYLSVFGEIFRMPIEILVGIVGKESGGEGGATGLEPWMPPPRDYVNEPPYTNRAGLERISPEQLVRQHESNPIPGFKYMLLTNIWNPEAGVWEGHFSATRGSETFQIGGYVKNPLTIREGRLVALPRRGTEAQRYRFDPKPPQEMSETAKTYRTSYTWQELLQDMDHFGNSPGPGIENQPPEALALPRRPPAWAPRERFRDNSRFFATLDQRISPGATQELTSNVRFGRQNDPEVRAEMERLDPEFFIQAGMTDANDRRNIFLRDTPPSFRFLWLLDPFHALFLSYRRLTNQSSDLEGVLSGKIANRDGRQPPIISYSYRLQNDQWDPIVVVTLHGGGADLQTFNPERPFGFGPSSPRWHTFPKKYNACVRFFEQYERFQGERALPLPSARFVRL